MYIQSRDSADNTPPLVEAEVPHNIHTLGRPQFQ